MNKQEAQKQKARSITALEILDSRAEAIALSLATHQRASEGLEQSLHGLLDNLVPVLTNMKWNNRLFKPVDVGEQTVWILIAPDFSGADKSVVSYRDLFFETAIAYINKAKDSVICIGASATDLAVAQGYSVLFSDSSDFSEQPNRPAQAEFLAQTVLDLAQQKDFGRATMLYLGPQQSVRHGLLPLCEYEGVDKAIEKTKPDRFNVMPDIGTFLIDSLSVAVSLAIGIALSRAAVFAQTARYQGLQKTKQKISGELQRLVRSIALLKSMSQQEDVTNSMVWFSKTGEA